MKSALLASLATLTLIGPGFKELPLPFPAPVCPTVGLSCQLPTR